jgi:hypothetical protein
MFLLLLSLIGRSSIMSIDAMGEEVRRLSDRPLPAAETDQSLYLYSEDMTLGTPEAPKKIIEGVVRIGKYHVIPLAAPPELGLKPEAWSLHLIELPFTLEKAPGERSYAQLIFRVKLADVNVTAYDLFPPSLTEARKQSLKFGLTPKLKFAWLDVGADFSYQAEFETLRPRITVFDVGRSDFRWEYEGTSSAPVMPGTRYALIVLEAPSKVTQVTGEIHVQAVVQKGWGELLRTVPALTSAIPIKWGLR